MTGVERLKEQIKDQEDMALNQTVNYLISRDELDQYYLKEEKTVDGMCEFVQNKGKKHIKHGWNYITNEVVYSWAIMYWTLPDKFLCINTQKLQDAKKSTTTKKETNINNVVSLEKAKQEMEKKKEVAQLSLFGGVAQ